MTMRLGHHHTFLTASALALASCAMASSTCDDLSKLALPQTTITMAAPAAPGAFAPPASFSLKIQPGDVDYRNLPAFCRVAATLRPTSDSVIKIELWLPPSGAWNGKFMAIGNGGQAGEIYYHKMGLPLTLGYAVASPDIRHAGKGGERRGATGGP